VPRTQPPAGRCRGCNPGVAYLATPVRRCKLTSPISVHGCSVWLHHYYSSICATGGIYVCIMGLNKSCPGSGGNVYYSLWGVAWSGNALFHIFTASCYGWCPHLDNFLIHDMMVCWLTEPGKFSHRNNLVNHLYFTLMDLDLQDAITLSCSYMIYLMC
jgi:hypothetical protein